MSPTPPEEKAGREDAKIEQPPRRNGSRARATRSAGDSSHPGLDLGDDPALQRMMWRIERIGWGVLLFILVAALLGLLGPGPLSRTYVVDPHSPLAMEYDRFTRESRPTQLRVHLLPGSSREGEARLAIDRRFLDSVEEVQVVPTPLRVGAGAGWVHYTFATTDPGLPAVVAVRYKPERLGGLSGRVALEGHGPIGFSQFVYP